MNLLIVESPGKIPKIRSFLPEGWSVAASVGHVRDLPLREMGVYPPDFAPRYEATERGQRTLADLATLAAKASEIYLATDPDREGEAIAWHLSESLSLKNPQRVAYAEITAKAIQEAIASPRPLNMNLVRAQEGRRVLDRLFGYLVSPALNTVSGQNLSAGRVQSPALRLVVERERAIRAFAPTTHYGVIFYFNGKKGQAKTWRASWNPKNFLAPGQDRLTDRALAQRAAALQSLTVSHYEEGEERQNPPPPFITSTLQQAASNALKMDPQRTMEVAQRLYESGHITYMRTDSPNLSDEAVAAIRALAAQRDWPLPEAPRTFKGKELAQEAHEAIRPTHFEDEERGDTRDEKALYRLIRLRAIASQLAAAVYHVVRASLVGPLDGKEATFEAKGRRLDFPGFKALLPADQAQADQEKDRDPDANNPIPLLSQGDAWVPADRETKTRKTTPPARYTQASLIRELENKGIGRPSTYAAILANVFAREYIAANEKRLLRATETGEKLIGYLSGNFSFLEYDFTRALEANLDRIALGQDEYLPVVREANAKLATEIKRFFQKSSVASADCPQCGSALHHFHKAPADGDKGYNYWKCPNPTCSSLFNDLKGAPDPSSRRASFLSAIACPRCGAFLRHLVRPSGPGGAGYDYWRCSKDSCMTTFNDSDGQPDLAHPNDPAPESQRSCPACGAAIRRLVREATPEHKGYDYWRCAKESCGSFYDDLNGAPDPATHRQSISSGYECPVCHELLRHNLKKSDAEGRGGYNYWGCPSQSCRTTFPDKDGAPDFSKATKTQSSETECPNCHSPLSHRQRIADNPAESYNYWKCPNDECGSFFDDKDDSPDLETERRSVMSDFKCPKCQSPMKHLIRPKSEKKAGYNFWACSDRSCGTAVNDKDDAPDFDAPRQSSSSDHHCPNCEANLHHLFRAPEGDHQGYNYWKCPTESCGSFFDDQDGAPNLKSARKSVMTDKKCPKCQSPLKHNVKDASETARGYNFWACSNRDCSARFNDDAGQPGAESKAGAATLSEHKCPQCAKPLVHRVREASEGARGYNFWSCSDRNCPTIVSDKDGAPDFDAPRQSSVSDHHCPDCNANLHHLFRAPEGDHQGYNYWKCPTETCGSFFDDQDGAPNLKSARKSVITDQKCPKCQSPLKHNVKDMSDAARGYNFWVCSNRDCSARFNDDAGKPGAETKAATATVSEHKCPQCSKPLIHRVREASEGSRGYNFWGCSGFPACKTTFEDSDGAPAFDKPPRASEPSEYKCPRCQGALYRRVGVSAKTGNPYDFFSCANQNCRATFNTVDDRPLINDTIRG
ncbi:MAG: type I DNA topoisomerase [Deltaproteobacteria bacterium]|jgi:DNA topoisomerase-1|nr:type I DNA topoisomerase [Deltaproteobacteria bacterium]